MLLINPLHADVPNDRCAAADAALAGHAFHDADPSPLDEVSNVHSDVPNVDNHTPSSLHNVGRRGPFLPLGRESIRDCTGMLEEVMDYRAYCCATAKT